jgi:hypothetical protein
MVKVLVVNKNSSGRNCTYLLFSSALNPESYDLWFQAGLLACPRFSPSSQPEKVSDILEKAQIGTHSYGYSR